MSKKKKEELIERRWIPRKTKAVGKFISIFFPIVMILIGCTALTISMLGTNSVAYDFIDVPLIYDLTVSGIFGGLIWMAVCLMIAIISYAIGTMIYGIGENIEVSQDICEILKSKPSAIAKPEVISKKVIDADKEATEASMAEPELVTITEEITMDIADKELPEGITNEVSEDVETVQLEEIEEKHEKEQLEETVESSQKLEEEPIAEEVVEQDTEEVSKPAEEIAKKPYVSPNFLKYYATLPKDFSMSNCPKRLDEQDKNVMHININEHFFKYTRQGDIFDDVAW